jgi:hypothetical protein
MKASGDFPVYSKSRIIDYKSMINDSFILISFAELCRGICGCGEVGNCCDFSGDFLQFIFLISVTFNNDSKG